MTCMLINLNSLISVVGFLDSIVAAKQNGARFGHSISPNRELVALGVGNLAGSFIPGTLPAFGSITRYGPCSRVNWFDFKWDRSRINGDVGGRTQIASLVCSGVVLLSMFFLLPWLYSLPKCVLGSMFVGNFVHWFTHFIVSYFSIARIVFSLLAETPHEIFYYFRFGVPSIIFPSYNSLLYVVECSPGSISRWCR